MLSPKYVNTKDLREQINLINPALGENKIKAFGVKKGELVLAFLVAVDSIPAGQEATLGIPDSVTLFYNSIVEGTDPITEPKQKKERAPRAPGVIKAVRENASEAVAERLVREGKTEEEFGAVFQKIYTDRGVINQDFINKRIGIYLRIGKKRAAIPQDPSMPKYDPGVAAPGEEALTGVASSELTE